MDAEDNITEENYLLFSSFLNNACSINNIPTPYQGPINFDFPTKHDKVKNMQTITHLLKGRDKNQANLSDAHAHINRTRQDLIAAQKKLKQSNGETEEVKKEFQLFRLRTELAERKLREEKRGLVEKVKSLTAQNLDLNSQKRAMNHQRRKQESQYHELQQKLLIKARGPPCMMMPIKPLSNSGGLAKKMDKEEIRLLQTHIKSISGQLDEVIEENQMLRESYLDMEVGLKRIHMEDREKLESAVNPHRYELPFTMTRREIEEELAADLRLIREKMSAAQTQNSRQASEEVVQEKIELEKKLVEQESTIKDYEAIIERYIDEGEQEMENASHVRAQTNKLNRSRRQLREVRQF